MYNNNFAFFLPTRKGSERIKNKNTRIFADIEGGILAIKIKQLLNVERVGEIVISTNDPQSIIVAKSFHNQKIKIVLRPEEYCLSSTKIEDLIKYIPSIMNSKHIFWINATAPFVDENILNKAIDTYMSEVVESKVYDSLFSVTKFQQFLWSKKENRCINCSRSLEKWPRTQDLEPLYEVNHAFYFNSVANFNRYNDRIGEKPLLYELNKIQSFDIDWEDDFYIAECIYKSIYTTHLL
jgi:N-acylneuraminate cytidylyltransferase